MLSAEEQYLQNPRRVFADCSNELASLEILRDTSLCLEQASHSAWQWPFLLKIIFWVATEMQGLSLRALQNGLADLAPAELSLQNKTRVKMSSYFDGYTVALNLQGTAMERKQNTLVWITNKRRIKV